MKSKLFFAMLMSSMLILIVPSCKKGTNDPFVSFRSRTTRLEGDWKATKYNMTRTEVVTSNGTPATTTITIVDNAVTYRAGVIVLTGTVNVNTLKFAKDGSFISSSAYTLGGNFGGTTVSAIFTVTGTGKWKFNGKQDGYKKNESITMSQLSESTTIDVTYNGSTTSDSNDLSWIEGQNVQVWHLIGLHNKKLEFELGEDYSLTTVDNGTTTVSAISKGMLTGTLEQ